MTSSRVPSPTSDAAPTRLADEVAALAALRDSRPGRVIGRPEYEAALTRMGRPATPGTIGNLRRNVAAVTGGLEPPSRSLVFDQTVLDDIARHDSFEAYYAYAHGDRSDTMSYSSWRRAFVAAVDEPTRTAMKATMTRRRSRHGAPTR